MASWREQVEAEFTKLLNLKTNWDSYGAEKIDPSMVEAARFVLSQVMTDDIPVPHVSPLNNGNVQLEWTRADYDIEVEMCPGRTCRLLIECVLSFDDLNALREKLSNMRHIRVFEQRVGDIAAHDCPRCDKECECGWDGENGECQCLCTAAGIGPLEPDRRDRATLANPGYTCSGGPVSAGCGGGQMPTLNDPGDG